MRSLKAVAIFNGILIPVLTYLTFYALDEGNLFRVLPGVLSMLLIYLFPPLLGHYLTQKVIFKTRLSNNDIWLLSFYSILIPCGIYAFSKAVEVPNASTFEQFFFFVAYFIMWGALAFIYQAIFGFFTRLFQRKVKLEDKGVLDN